MTGPYPRPVEEEVTVTIEPPAIPELPVSAREYWARVEERSIDAAVRDIPGAWDLASVTGQRHGYGWHAVLECGVVGPGPVHGFGRTIPEAIRAASGKVEPPR